MLNRVFLYISKNFVKMVSTLIMFVVMLSVIGTLVYVYSTVNNRVDQTGLIRRNYIVDDEKIYNQSESEENSETASYTLIYEELKNLDGLEAYKIDVGYASVYNFVMDDATITDSKTINFQIADDFKQIDFVTGAVEIISGELNSTGIVISEEISEEYDVTIGDTLDVSSFFLMDSEIDFSQDSKMTFSYTYEVEVSGIYSSSSSDDSDSMDTVYLSESLYSEISNAIKIEEEKLSPEAYEYSTELPDFERVLAQYDNKDSANSLDKFVKENFDTLYIVDSTKEINKSTEPLADFNQIVFILIIVIALISAVGIYLNMYLKLEKRRSEFIALLGCGINSFKLSMQVFFEQLIFVIIALPFSYLFVNSLVKLVIEIIKKYYIVLINEISVSDGGVYGSWLDYVTIDSTNIVDFTNANLLSVMLISVGIIIISLLLLCLFEVNRRYKNVKKV